MENNGIELNKLVLGIIGFDVDSEKDFKESLESFEKIYGVISLTLIQFFITNCTIDDFERLKLIASNYEVTNNF